MDKETLSNYGWIVICILVLSVMIALATPFGNYIKTAVENTTEGLFETSNKGLSTVGASADNSNFAFTDGTVKHHYYSSIALAVSDAGEHTTANADCDKDTASAEIAVREKDDKYIVKALKNQTITESIEMKGEQIFDTNSKEIELKAGVELKPVSNSVITFRDEGGKGKIYKDVDTSSAEKIIEASKISDCTVNILNGTYDLKNKSKGGFLLGNSGITNIQQGKFTSSSETGNVVVLNIRGKANISDGSFSALSESAISRTIQFSGNETSEISNCKIIAESEGDNSQSQGICLIANSKATLMIKSSDIYAKSSGSSGKAYGIMCVDGVININNCKVVSNSLNDSQAITRFSDGTGNIYIKDGQYEATGNTMCVVKDATSIDGGIFKGSTSDGQIWAIQDVVNIKNAKINCYATNDNKNRTAKVYAIFYSNKFNKDALIENASVLCDYNLENVSDDYICEGVQVSGDSPMQSLTINNCNVKATREALSLASSNVYINGGTYEGIRHGGAYFGCLKAVVKNATFRKWNYDGQFNKNNFYSYDAAFYIGSPNHEVKVYMDNCKLENATNAVLSSNYSYKNTYLYASNTAFNNIRIDGANSAGDKGHMYIGKGTTYKSTSGSGELDKTTYKDVEFTPEYVEANF